MTNKPLLVLGTRNRKKGLEILDLLAPLGFEVQTLADYPAAVDVEEDGQSFLENAEKKAREQARQLNRWVLGEDSGLVVDALGGAPGIYSARYAGPESDDEANNSKLLEELVGMPLEKRTAHYVCTAALSDPQGEIQARCEGRCHGRILTERHGTAGFGYDPLFEVPEYHQTFGQLGEVVKRFLSHRSRALRKLVPQLLLLVSSGQWRP